MIRYREQLRAIAADAFVVAADRARLGDDEIALGGPQGPCAGLAQALYARHYCRPPAVADPTSGQDPAAFLAALRAASRLPLRHQWWTVAAADAHGLLLADDRGVTRRAAYGEALPGPGGFAPGEPVRIVAPVEMLTGPHGHYVVTGRAIADAREGRQVRFYWNLAPAGAAAFLGAIAGGLDRRRIPFQAKVPAMPSDYCRADGGVLYLNSEDVEASLDVVSAARAAVGTWLRPDAPLFTRPIAQGLAFAESPPSGESFGMHRSRLVAEGLVRAFENKATDADGRAAAVCARLAQYGLDLDSLERNAGTRYPYRFESAVWE